jgi:hypothetical protein
MDIFIGIDQSINSTGVTVQCNGNENFYIIKGTKLTAKENKAHTSYNNFEYVLYNKEEIKDANNNHVAEIIKTMNLIRISRTIIGIISYYIKQFDNCNVYVCMEGISYQSAQTKSIMDLAGLNYIIRYDLIKYFTGIQEAISRIEKYKIIVATPGEIKKFASGNGSAKKEIMIKLFETTHPNLYLIPKIDDVADSFWMSEYAKTLV